MNKADISTAMWRCRFYIAAIILLHMYFYFLSELQALNYKRELKQRLEDETLLFCVSEFPTVKLIEAETEK